MTVANVYASIEAVRQGILQPSYTKGIPNDPAWRAKMLHAVPDLPVVPDRTRYLVEKATGQVVLDLGSSGPVSAAVKAVAKTYYGVDKAPLPGVEVCDFDVAPVTIPTHLDVTLILATEILEHLTNPGAFLRAVARAYPRIDAYISVPHASIYTLVNGTHEMVNADHVCWYSYTTLATLLRKTGWVIDKARLYNPMKDKAEGLIVQAHAEPPA